jgi:hypothetical protein
MGELDVAAMRRRIGRDEFNAWMVAYYELHLDGSMNAARVTSALHNKLGPAVARYLEQDLSEFKFETPEDHVPRIVFGDEPVEPPQEDDADDLDRQLEEAEKRWG